MRNKEKIRSLNDQGDRSVAHIVATNRGMRAKDAPAESAGGLAQQTYICRGARCMVATAVWKEWSLYDGEIVEAAGIIYRPCDRPPRSLPACVLVSFPKYFGPIFLPDLPNVSPVAPIERVLDCRRLFSRTTAPLLPARGLTFHISRGMTGGAGREAECAATNHEATSFEKSHPGGLYAAASRAMSAGRGVFGEHGFGPSALYLHALCSRERVLHRADNAIAASREASRCDKRPKS